MSRSEDRRVLSAMRQLLYGGRREGGRTQYRSEKARETALRHKPWTRGRIGTIETAIARETIMGQKDE